jgi:hypothetical protein
VCVAIDRYEDNVARGANTSFPIERVREELAKLGQALGVVAEALGVRVSGDMPPMGDRAIGEPLTPERLKYAEAVRGNLVSDEALALMGLLDMPLPEWFLGAEPPDEWRAHPWTALSHAMGSALYGVPRPGTLIQIQQVVRDLEMRVQLADGMVEWFRPRGGRPKDQPARALAYHLAFIWDAYVKVPMTRDILGGGNWVEFVAAVFETAGAGTGASYARKLASLFKRSR